jgi:thymidylate synthase
VLNLVDVKATTLNEAWFRCIELVLENGRIWTVEGKKGDEKKGDTDDRSHIGSGSFVGSKRWEFDHVRVHITDPGCRPLVPDVPAGVPAPTDMEYVERYYQRYLVGTEREGTETYTYGERIQPQLEPIVDKFTKGGPGGTPSWGSNQCTIAIAKPEDILLPDPPCLRELDFRVYPEAALSEHEEQALHMTAYFRSWDLWGGFPSNLAALRLLQEDMAAAMGIPAGEIIGISKGLHLYEQSWDVAKLRVMWEE